MSSDMKIKAITIHNFRSIKDGSFNLEDYSVLIGANNQGKSNILKALRVFYEYNKLKYIWNEDFPKFKTDDKESWIEIEYTLTNNEYQNLKNEYRLSGNALKVRKYLQSDNKDRVKSNQSNIFGYTKDRLSNSLFYGARNISNAKLGSIIYIPDVMKTEDAFKLKSPSPFREILTFVVGKVVKKSQAYQNLQESFKDFNDNFSTESSTDGFSIKALEKNINDHLLEWDVKFNVDIDSIDSDTIIKSLVTHSLSDTNLDGQIEIKQFGQGLQRHLIYTLLKVSTEYVDKKESNKKEFDPDFTLILFEEPEAFLHPSQQEILNNSLNSLAENVGQQILISTHSPTFVSKNIDLIPSLIRIEKLNGVTQFFQIIYDKKEEIIKENDGLIEFLETKCKSSDVSQADKNAIIGLLRGNNLIKRLEEEAIRYLLWLDTERCCSFFADNVLICEGPTEKRFLDYMMKNHWQEFFKSKKIYVLECGGKFQIHRFMNLFKYLGINHSVLYDRDNSNLQKYINEFINLSKNSFTQEIDYFDKDIESFLNVDMRNIKNHNKPLNLMWNYKKEKIAPEKIDELKNKIIGLL